MDKKKMKERARNYVWMPGDLHPPAAAIKPSKKKVAERDMSFNARLARIVKG